MSLGPRVVLVGPPGAGKTSVGRLLAQRWRLAFTDTDELVEAEQGKAISDLFVEDGEAAFRVLEQTAVRRGLQEATGVLALGGGAVLAPETRSALADQEVVFLDVGLAAAASRVGLGLTRPLLLGNVRSQLKALLDARRPLYVEVANVVVATDGLSVEQVADEVERLLA